MLANTTIKVRVIAAFAVVLLTTVCLGLFAVQRLNAVNAAARDIGENWLPGANSLGDLSQDFEYFRSLQGQLVTTSGDMRKTKLGKLAKTEKRLAEDFATYEKTVENADERAMADAIQAHMQTYTGMQDAYMQKMDAGDNAGALDYFTVDMQPVVDKLRAAIRKDREYQLVEGRKAAEAGIKLGENAGALILAAIALTALICSVIGFVMIRTISAPIRKMSDVMATLAGGDTSVKIPNAGERSEIGDMAKAVDVFKDGMIRNRALEAQAAQTREQAEVERKQTMRALADQFEGAVGGIVEMVSSAATEMQATASQLSASAQESAAQATSVSAAAEEAGTNVTSVAGAAEELGASVSEIGRQVEHSLQKAREAVTEADNTAAIVYQLSEAAGRINSIVEMISGIASQTNLLALNATIESARAGEAGRGFAVVATEVKALAQQTAKATEEINAQVAGIQATTRQAVDAIEGFTGTIRAISDTSTSIAAAVEEQGAATSEIVQAVSQASVGTAEVTSNITGVARMAEETGAGANQVLGASSELAQQAANLRTQVQAFLAQVRAA